MTSSLLQLFLDHMRGYDRIFTMRRLQPGPERYEYEFVEIPKTLMLEAAGAHSPAGTATSPPSTKQPDAVVNPAKKS